ncbi:hypothetical protein GCM10009743_45810 [Kribbella swartbergensis]
MCGAGTGWLEARTFVRQREYSATWLRSLIDDVAALRRPHAAAHGTSDAHGTHSVDVMLATPVDARQITGAPAHHHKVPSPPPSVAEPRFAAGRVERIVLAVVVFPLGTVGGGVA